MSARRRKKPEQTLFSFAEEECPEPRRGLDELFAAVGGYRKRGRFLRLLACAARFRAYGPYNALLAALQRPEAVCVLPPAKWRRYNRVVKPTARPIVLLRPYAPVSCVFDVSDTSVIRGREDRFPAECAEEEFEPLRPVPDAVVKRLLDRLPWWGIRHETVPTGPAAVGEIHVCDAGEPEMTVPTGDGGVVRARPAYVLRTRADAPPTELFTALARALARLFCRHLRSGYERGWGDGRALTEAQEIFETDAAVWLLCRRLEVASPVYGEFEAVLGAHDAVTDASMDAVLDAVAGIESMLDASCTVRKGALFRRSPSFAARLDAPALPIGGLA